MIELSNWKELGKVQLGNFEIAIFQFRNSKISKLSTWNQY